MTIPKPTTHREARLLVFFAMLLSDHVPDEFWEWLAELTKEAA